MTIRILSVLALLAIAAPAAAQPVTPPAGWVADERHAAVVERDLVAAFGPIKSDIAVWSWRSPEPGGQIVVSQIDAGVTGTGGGYVRQRVDELRGTVDVIASDGGQVRTVGWTEHTDPKQQVVEAKLEWANDSTGVVSVARAIWTRPAAPGDLVREVRAECLFAADEATRLRPACDQVLAALDPGDAPRATIEMPAVVATPPEEPSEPPTMRETPDSVPAVLAQRPPAAKEERDLRPFYVAGFVLIVFAALWWNRKRHKDVLEAEAGEKSEPRDE